jgi:hypothetical protein
MAEDRTPKYTRGADLSQVPLSKDLPAIDLDVLLGTESANPYLNERRVEEGLLSEDDAPPERRSRPAVDPE